MADEQLHLEVAERMARGHHEPGERHPAGLAGDALRGDGHLRRDGPADATDTLALAWIDFPSLVAGS